VNLTALDLIDPHFAVHVVHDDLQMSDVTKRLHNGAVVRIEAFRGGQAGGVMWLRGAVD
jgi:hypothetical protein